MLVIGKTLVLFLLELIIEYLFGTMLTKLVLKREVHPLMSLLVGFISYQALFQVVALSFILTTRVLHHLTIAWTIVLLITIIAAIAIAKDTVKHQIAVCLQEIRAHKAVFVVAVLVVIAFGYYASINGEDNEDARYYIALMTTSVDTDSMFKYNVYNGYQVESLYLRRALATFEMQGAVLCQLFGIHPLVIARVFRACQDVVLTSAAIFLCGNILLWEKEEQATEKSLWTVVVFWFVQILFANTIYTPATFLLYRAYEAKAFTANVIVLMGLYLCVRMLREKDGKMLVLIAVFVWGSAAISTSAVMIAAAECVVLLVPVWVYRFVTKKKQEKLHAS